MRTETAKGRMSRPLRPFLLGVMTGALWGALHVPALIDAATVTQLVAVATAIAVVSGGALALTTEVAALGPRLLRGRWYGRRR